jgi:DNA repair protein RadC
MAISDWPKSERPREKLMQQGPDALSDAELLAIFLRTGIAGKTAVDLARELIMQYGGLRPLLEADFTAFCSAPGLGLAKYTQLQAILEMSRRHLRESLQRGTVLENPQQTRDYLTSELRGYGYEVFSCLFLDNRHRVIQFEKLFFGTINSATVHPREVVKRALKHNAAAVILSHNHPSGVSEPSQADVQITGHLKEALALVDIRLLDHFIIGDGELVSLAERGLV